MSTSTLHRHIGANSAYHPDAPSDVDPGTVRDAAADIGQHAGLQALGQFPLLDALFGRRARRFGVGMAIPDGPLAYTSQQPARPLSELERSVLILAGAGVSGWALGIPHTPTGTPDTGCNYPARFIGRTYPSGAGIHTSELLINDDSGTYITNFRTLNPERDNHRFQGSDAEVVLALARRHVTQLSKERVRLPQSAEHMAPHNYWVANQPGSTLFVPVINLSEHMLSSLAMSAQAGAVLTDLTGTRPLGDPQPLIAAGRLQPARTRSLAELEQSLLHSATIEGGIMAYNIALLLQGIGLGGWLYAGINPPSLLGAYAAQGVPGFGFRFDTREDWATPNPIGLDRHFEGLVPPYVRDMHEAVEFAVARRFGEGGTYDPATPGPFRDNAAVKGRIERYSPELVAYLASVAQDIYATYGRFPATLPGIFTSLYTQAHHIDLDFYARFYAPDAVLETHHRHAEQWDDGADRDDGTSTGTNPVPVTPPSVEDALSRNVTT